MPVIKVPEINVSSEPTLQSKSPPELKSGATANESIVNEEITDVKADILVKKVPEFAMPNEVNTEIGFTDVTSERKAHRKSIDSENNEAKSETSASDLSKIVESNNPNMQKNEEFVSEEPVTRNADDSSATGVTSWTSADKSLERDETTKDPGFDDPNKGPSEISEARLDGQTKENTEQHTAVDDVSAQGKEEAAFERTSLRIKMAKRFANADSYDELDEDNETASTGAESAESDTIELLRSDDATQGDSVEEVDKVFKTIDTVSLEDITKECVQISDSRDTNALNEEPHSNQEQSVGERTHETSVEQESLDHFADDTKNHGTHTSTSEGNALETVPAEFCEATEDDHTAELAKGSEGVLNSLLVEADGGTSEALSKGGNAHAPESEKRSCEGTDGRNVTPEQFSTEDLANVIDNSEGRMTLTNTRSEEEKGDALDPEISASQNIVDATKPSAVEAYNLTTAGSSLSYHFARETKDDRSSLLAYAEEVVSTVLTMCITYLEENDQEWRTTELVDHELNAHVESTTEKATKTASGDDDEEHGASLLQSDYANEGPSGGDVFEPIVSRQSAFEEAVPLADQQYLNTNRDLNQAVPIISTSAEKAEDSGEMPSSALISEKQGEAENERQIDETATKNKTADNAESDVPLKSAEDASDNTASISEALTEDAGSSETHSSTSGANKNQIPDQVVVQSDQSEEKRGEEEEPVVAHAPDFASSDTTAEVSETRRNFVESDSKDDSEEPEHIIVMTAPLTNQESKLHEESFTESAACVSEKEFERSVSEVQAQGGDDSRVKEEAEHETAANSFSESSATTVSMKTEDSGKSVSVYSSRASQQASDPVPANEVNKDNSGTENTREADVENEFQLNRLKSVPKDPVPSPLRTMSTVQMRKAYLINCNRISE
ncbi:microtubule-associated protein futsch-like [Rhipicephalus sanguineus]|uniref:microtubule-associated protein futsch-like n=1 Tax=Rhipicephalus sanguineus TaxID=34632 RepID=UPI0020C3AD4D|nr:microtubule-associated protein futsch-like [Rhipicephalus sanguineus]